MRPHFTPSCATVLLSHCSHFTSSSPTVLLSFSLFTLHILESNCPPVYLTVHTSRPRICCPLVSHWSYVTSPCSTAKAESEIIVGKIHLFIRWLVSADEMDQYSNETSHGWLQDQKRVWEVHWSLQWVTRSKARLSFPQTTVSYFEPWFFISPKLDQPSLFQFIQTRNSVKGYILFPFSMLGCQKGSGIRHYWCEYDLHVFIGIRDSSAILLTSTYIPASFFDVGYLEDDVNLTSWTFLRVDCCLPLSSIVFHRLPLSSIVFYRLPSSFIVFRCLLLSSIIFHCLPFSSIVSRCLPLSSIVFRCLRFLFHCLSLSSIVFRFPPLSSVVFHRLPSSSIVFRCLRFSSIVFYCLLSSSDLQQSARPKGRIIGGTRVVDRCVAPYNSMVALQLLPTNPTLRITYCSGVMLSADLIVTAALCVYPWVDGDV